MLSEPYESVNGCHWRFEHGEWEYLFSYAYPVGWMFEATDDQLRFNPPPDIEVRRRRLDGCEWRTVKHEPVAGWTDKRRTAPIEVLKETVTKLYNEITA